MQSEAKEGAVWLVDKPYGWTSFKAVHVTKRATKSKKAGHAGTLDPLATGLLIICTEKKTKTIEGIQGLPKVYETEILLGAATPSGDLETEVNETAPTAHITKEMVEKTLLTFIGDIAQTPSAFSAIKINGQRAYELARKGEEVTMKSRIIHISAIELMSFKDNILKIKVGCSKGTYIRTLGMDIAKSLQTVGHLISLRRTAIGDYLVENAKTPDEWRDYLAKEE